MRSLLSSLCFIARLPCLLAALAGVSARAHAPRPKNDHELIGLSAASSPSLAQVRSHFGEPAQRIGADLWVYWNCPTSHPIAQREGDDTLIVHVVGGHARTIKLVRGAEVRAERTETESLGFVRARVASTAAQQLADPAGSAARDYSGNRRRIEGDYTKSFPSAHLNHDITPNLKARVSWSTSFGRPPLSNLLPNETPNEAAQTVTINNPGLLPQTAKNWDASLEYYFEPVGSISAGWFHKSIRDYILNNVEGGTVAAGNGNGFNGEYAGFRILTRSNAGTATVQGWEFGYQQQFTFFPGLLKGLGASANYTVIQTAGDFGGAATRSTNQVPGFIPRTGNFALVWRYRSLGARVGINYLGTHITNYNATAAQRSVYRFSRTITTAGVAWHARPSLTLTADVSNLFNEPEAFYRGSPDRIQSYNIAGITLTVGVNGRF